MGSFRFFVDVEQFECGAEVVLRGDEAYHARRVMRVKVGERVSLINGKGWVAQARVESVEKSSVRLQVLTGDRVLQPQEQLWLVMANLRPNHLDFAIEKGVEVGVDHFVLFAAEGSEIKKISEAKIRRIRALIKAAVKQCGRVFSPSLEIVRGLKEVVEIVPGPILWADPTRDAQPLSKRLSCSSKESVSLCIGPEKGWSDHERALLSQSGEPVILHENILRAETAAVVGAYEIASWFSREG